MRDFFKNPNLPEGGVSALIIGEDYCQRLEPALGTYGISILHCPINPHVDERLASHADLSVFHLGGVRFVLAAYLKGAGFARELEALGAELIFTESRQGSAYPRDAGLCALSLGKSVYHNEMLCDSAVRSNVRSFVHTAQGYAKCAVCAVSENAVITADEGMARVLEAHGIDVLRISATGVLLAGFSNGFIGGAAFKLSKDLLAFTGSLSLHPDGERIENFLRLHGVKPICLTDEPLFDIGSAIPIF